MARSSYQPRNTDVGQREYLYDVFLSHHSSDKPVVEMLAVRLEEARLKPFLDKWHLVPGAPWQEELEDALDKSASCAVFLGPQGIGAWQNEEMRAALDDRIRNGNFRVIPVLLPQAEPADDKQLPRFLRRLTWVDFRGGLEDADALRCLVAGIKGEQPGRPSSCTLSEQRKTFIVVLSGTINEVDKARVEAITEHLRQISGDFSLTIHKVESGSIRLIVECSKEGYERLGLLFRRGAFREVQGLRVVTLEPLMRVLDEDLQIPEEERMYRDALLAREKVLGLKFPKIMPTLNHLAMSFQNIWYTAFENAFDELITATVLADSVYRASARAVTGGANLEALKRGLNQAVERAVDEIKRLSRPVRHREAVIQVGTISANGDYIIGEIVAEAMKHVGKDGIVTVEESETLQTELEIVKGMQFDRGYLSPYFVTDPERMETVLDWPLILLHEKKISVLHDLLPVLEQAAAKGRSLLIIAGDVGGEALATLYVNKLRNTLNIAAVKAPGFGDHRRDMLEDIAILTGGRIITDGNGIKLKDVTLADLGSAKRAIVDKDDTIIIEGAGDAKAIQEHVATIRTQIEKTTSDYDRKKLQERLSKLAGIAAIIKVGAATEIEMKEKKAHVDDAIRAVRAALQGGIVPASGITLIYAAKALDRLSLIDDEQLGVGILKQALGEPLQKVAETVSTESKTIIQRIKAEIDEQDYRSFLEETKFDALARAGAVEPAKTVYIALRSAVTLAESMLMDAIKSKQALDRTADDIAGDPYGA